MKITEQQPSIHKSFHGWTGQTIKTIQGQTYKITTMKRHHGRITSIATPGTVEGDEKVLVFTYLPGAIERIYLNESDKRATSKHIKDLHTEALQIFDRKMNPQTTNQANQ